MSTNFPTSLDAYTTKVDNTDMVMAVDINNVQDAIEALEAKVGIDSSAVTTSLDYKVNNFFVAGRKVYLYENTAPTGWSIVAVTDKVLAVKGGTGSYNVDGGNTAGDFTITEAQMPAHYHLLFTPGGYGLTTELIASNYAAHYGWSGDPFYHIAAEAAAPTLGRSETKGSGAATYRPAACVGIIVQKS